MDEKTQWEKKIIIKNSVYSWWFHHIQKCHLLIEFSYGKLHYTTWRHAQEVGFCHDSSLYS